MGWQRGRWPAILAGLRLSSFEDRPDAVVVVLVDAWPRDLMAHYLPSAGRKRYGPGGSTGAPQRLTGAKPLQVHPAHLSRRSPSKSVLSGRGFGRPELKRGGFLACGFRWVCRCRIARSAPRGLSRVHGVKLRRLLGVRGVVAAGSAATIGCSPRPSRSGLPFASGVSCFPHAGASSWNGSPHKKKPARGKCAGGPSRCERRGTLRRSPGGACGRRTRLTIPDRFMGPCAACDNIILQKIMFLSRRRLAKCSIMNASALPA
jgi:hypothetical protein